MSPLRPVPNGPAAVTETPRADPELARLVRAAANGDDDAWARLVGRFDATVRSAARGYRLAPADVDDVAQTTWLRALEHFHQLREPEAIAGWLVVTARREAMRMLQRGVHELPGDVVALDQTDPQTPASLVAAYEREAAVRRAVSRLSGRQRRLLECMLASPAPTYAELSSRAGVPVGSIGPTRQRALERLRCDVELLATAGS